jgi:hypothetical protein
MAKMTEEEAWALDEKLTDVVPMLEGSGHGFLTRRYERDLLESLDSLSAGYIRSQSEANHQTPAEVIGTLVRKELASAS